MDQKDVFRWDFEVIEPAFQVVHAGMGRKGLYIFGLHSDGIGLSEDSDGGNAV